MPVTLPILGARSCGECSACCTTMAVDEIVKPRDTRCEHAMLRGGCSVYETRPEACRHFKCAWLNRDSPLLTTSTRPDKLGVVFWQEVTRLGVTIVAQEIRARALESGPVRVLATEFSRHRPVVLRRMDGTEAIEVRAPSGPRLVKG